MAVAIPVAVVAIHVAVPVAVVFVEVAVAVVARFRWPRTARAERARDGRFIPLPSWPFTWPFPLPSCSLRWPLPSWPLTSPFCEPIAVTVRTTAAQVGERHDANRLQPVLGMRIHLAHQHVGRLPFSDKEHTLGAERVCDQPAGQRPQGNDRDRRDRGEREDVGELELGHRQRGE